MENNPSPSQEAVANAAKTVEITDKATGKVIVLRKPSVLAQYDFIEMLGPVRSTNAAYVEMSLPTLYVVSIDGQPVTQPAKFAEFRALVQRLGDSGVSAVGLAIIEHFGSQKTPAEVAEEIKK